MSTERSGPSESILLAHGSGGRAMHELITRVFIQSFTNPWLSPMEDGADLGDWIVATDCHVVSPLFFPGGDIGTLAVNGTLNDVAVAGGKPRFLTAGFILEEGLPLDTLKRVVSQMAEAARRAGVAIVTGDTKVVERGACDGLYVCTTGLGPALIPNRPAARRIRSGDHILVSGPVGSHGACILSARQPLGFSTDIVSDCRNLAPLVEGLLTQFGDAIHALRDPTRGGLTAVLHEWSEQAGLPLRLQEEHIPIQPNVQSLCELLGLDALSLACEGVLVLVCAAEEAGSVLTWLRQQPECAAAQDIGEVIEGPAGRVELTTAYGGRRLLDWRHGDPLPRIC